MTADIIIYPGLTLAELVEMRSVQLVLHYGLLVRHNDTHRKQMDDAIRKARDAGLIEYVVDDDWKAEVKTITIYPAGGCPIEDEWRVNRRDDNGNIRNGSLRHGIHAGRADGRQARAEDVPAKPSARPLLRGGDHPDGTGPGDV